MIGNKFSKDLCWRWPMNKHWALAVSQWPMYNWFNIPRKGEASAFYKMLGGFLFQSTFACNAHNGWKEPNKSSFLKVPKNKKIRSVIKMHIVHPLAPFTIETERKHEKMDYIRTCQLESIKMTIPNLTPRFLRLLFPWQI